MQEIYGYIQECDNIVIASPMQFTEISGQLLAVLSRLQTYWSARFFRKTEPVEKKSSGIILSGREPYRPKGRRHAKGPAREITLRRNHHLLKKTRTK
jgi:multimeric flavodoxin WrbA